MNNGPNIIEPIEIDSAFQTVLAEPGTPPYQNSYRSFDSNSNPYPCYYNPYTGYPVNTALADKFILDSIAREQEFGHKLEIERQKAAYARDLEDKKHDNAMKRIEGIMDRKEELDNATEAIFKDSDGRFCLEKRYPNKPPKHTPPILNCVNLQAYQICDMETHEQIRVVLTADNLKNNIIIEKEDINSRGVSKSLSSHGFEVTIGRDKKRNTCDLLYSYLMRESQVIEQATHSGWNRTNSGWMFILLKEGQEQKQESMSTEEKNRLYDYILILKSLAANLPILQTRGYIFPRTLKVIVEPGMQYRTMDVLRNFSKQDSDNWTSEFHFYSMNALPKDVFSRVEMEVQEGISTVVTDNPIADDEEHNYFFVFLEERKHQLDYCIEEIVPNMNDLESIFNKLAGQDETEMSEEERILRAAVYCLEPYFFRKGELYRINELLDSVAHMCADDEVVREENDMSKVFLDNLYDWQERTNFSNLCNLDEGAATNADINETIYYNADFVYMAEKLFKKIVEPIREYAPINTLKRSLRDNDVILIDKGCSVDTYTVQISVPCIEGSKNRVRMLRFKKDSLTKAGDLDFIFKCSLTNEGGDCDEWNCREN